LELPDFSFVRWSFAPKNFNSSKVVPKRRAIASGPIVEQRTGIGRCCATHLTERAEKIDLEGALLLITMRPSDVGEHWAVRRQKWGGFETNA
jgi:hypothetical protein